MVAARSANTSLAAGVDSWRRGARVYVRPRLDPVYWTNAGGDSDVGGRVPGATAFRGSLLAFFYCLGLGIPFVVAALATEWMATASVWLRRHSRTIGVIGGVLLIAIGVCEVTGWWHSFVLWLQVHVPSSTAVL